MIGDGLVTASGDAFSVFFPTRHPTRHLPATGLGDAAWRGFFRRAGGQMGDPWWFNNHCRDQFHFLARSSAEAATDNAGGCADKDLMPPLTVGNPLVGP